MYLAYPIKAPSLASSGAFAIGAKPLIARDCSPSMTVNTYQPITAEMIAEGLGITYQIDIDNFLSKDITLLLEGAGYVMFEEGDETWVVQPVKNARQEMIDTNDLYTLGCYQISFLRDHLGFSTDQADAYSAFQNADKHESAGAYLQSIISVEDLVDKLIAVEGYVSLSSYDGEIESLSLEGLELIYYRHC